MTKPQRPRKRGIRVAGKGAVVTRAPGYPEVVTYAPGQMMPADMVQKIDDGLRDGTCTVTFGK